MQKVLGQEGAIRVEVLGERGFSLEAAGDGLKIAAIDKAAEAEVGRGKNHD